MAGEGTNGDKTVKYKRSNSWVKPCNPVVWNDTLLAPHGSDGISFRKPNKNIKINLELFLEMYT